MLQDFNYLLNTYMQFISTNVTGPTYYFLCISCV